MLNISVTGTALSSYYLADPTQFLREQRARTGVANAAGDIRQAARDLKRLTADIDETSTHGATRSRVLQWLTYFGWQFPTRPDTLDDALTGCDAGLDPRASVLIAPAGQHLDTSPTGRRSGKLRPQRLAEVTVRNGSLPAVLATNGSELRIIRKDPGLGGEANYLSIDLPGLADLGDEHEWKLVWALLRPEAFAPDANGANLWDLVEKASVDAATKVTESLSDGVRIAIAQIANGALADRRRRGEPDPPARALLGDALRIAYRLLFVAFAEDRGLLPVGTPIYDSGYSLRALRRQVIDPQLVWEPDSTFLWGALRAAWGILREGADAGELKITGFNGGLFAPEQCPLLDEAQLGIGDTFLREAIIALGYTQPTRAARSVEAVGRRPINYRELGVEQLGSVYEGLLAYEPHIAEQPKTVVQVGRGQSALEQVVNADQVPESAEILREMPTGTFYQFQATGERKGAGAFYTPRPLAHFVVVETLRPLVENATSDEILNLRVCDPAMGSGAFLVPAVHQLTEAYGEALIREGKDIDHKLDDTERAAYRRLIVERCIYGVDLNPMAVDLAKVSLWLATAAAGKPLSFLDAHLRCGNAIIGAQLGSFEGVPVPALDSRVTARAEEPELTLFDLPDPDLTSVIKVRRDLAERPSEDRLQVREKERRFARLLESEDYTTLRALGDWWVAPFFFTELHRRPALWRQGRSAIKNPAVADNITAESAHRIVAKVREELRPFHWEIEFAEVFFDARGVRRPDAGFDVMIGNPPWEGITFKSAEFFGRFDPSYSLLPKRGDERTTREAALLERPEVTEAKAAADAMLDGTKAFIKESGNFWMLYAHGVAFNLYRAFLEHEMSLLAPSGRIGLTIDAGVVAGATTSLHRRELLDHYTIEQFVLCDNKNKIFPIHSSEQFLLLVAQQGGATDPLPFTSSVDLFEHLLDLPSRTMPISRAALSALDPENLSVPDTRDPALLDLLTAIYAGKPFFLDDMPVGGWTIDWGREFNIRDDRANFAIGADGAPLREGKHIHQFVHDFAEPTYNLLEPVAGQNLFNRAKKRRKLKSAPASLHRRKGEQELVGTQLRDGGIEIPFDHYRLCYRETASATNERTLIAAVVPPRTAIAHSLHWFYRSSWLVERNGYRTVLPAEAMVYVAAIVNSLVLDFIVRRKAASHVTKTIMSTLPVADVKLDQAPGAEVVRLSARLTCRSSAFDELAQVLGVQCAPLSQEAERELRAELDARVALLYGLSAEQFELILADFRQSDSSESSPVRPNDEYKDRVRHHFKALAG